MKTSYVGRILTYYSGSWFRRKHTRSAEGLVECVSVPENKQFVFRHFSCAGMVTAVAFSPDGKIAALACTTCGLQFLGKCCLTQAPRHITHEALVYCLVFSPDGKTIAVAAVHKPVMLYPVCDGRHRLRFLGQHSDETVAMSFSPDGRTLASGGADKTVRLWSVASGRCLKIFSGHVSAVQTAGVSPDNRVIASGSTDGIKLWSIHGGECLMIKPGHILALAFQDDGHSIASVSLDDQTLKIWSLPNDGGSVQ